MKNSESREMYLETILQLQRRGARVRAVDVAGELGFSRTSVSVAMKRLQADGLVILTDSGELSLTDEGMRLAAGVFERHCVLTELFGKMGAARDVAEENACRIEHILSDEMFALIKAYNARQ